MKNLNQLADELLLSDATWGEYKTAIQKTTGYDIDKFKPSFPGSKVKTSDITRFSVDAIIQGMKVESEHTTDKGIQLEICLAHLDEFPKYYDELEKMEKQFPKETKGKKEGLWMTRA